MAWRDLVKKQVWTEKMWRKIQEHDGPVPSKQHTRVLILILNNRKRQCAKKLRGKVWYSGNCAQQGFIKWSTTVDKEVLKKFNHRYGVRK